MNPFTSLEDAKAHLRGMSNQDLAQLQYVTMAALEAGAITEASSIFVSDLIVDEAMRRMTEIVENALGIDLALQHVRDLIDDESDPRHPQQFSAKDTHTIH
jgi:hypothetical protein